MPSSLSLKNRLIIFFLMLLSTLLVGSLGYVVIKIYVEHESTSITNALFFSVATISTLGHYPKGIELTSNVGKWFTIFYLIFGMGTIFGGIQALVTPWIEMRIRNAIKERGVPIPRDAHVIICGWNDIAKLVEEQLKMMEIPYVIISTSPPEGVPAIEGEASEVSSLKKANVDRATALIALLDDRSNVVTVLTARKLNENLRIIALAREESIKDLLIQSGADVVISKEKLLGSILEQWVKGDQKYLLSGEMFENLKIKERIVDKNLQGKTLRDLKFREREGTAIGIYRSGNLLLNPSPDELLERGDVIIFMESEENADFGLQ